MIKCQFFALFVQCALNGSPWNPRSCWLLPTIYCWKIIVIQVREYIHALLNNKITKFYLTKFENNQKNETARSPIGCQWWNFACSSSFCEQSTFQCSRMKCTPAIDSKVQMKSERKNIDNLIIISTFNILLGAQAAASGCTDDAAE